MLSVSSTQMAAMLHRRFRLEKSESALLPLKQHQELVQDSTTDLAVS
jgi:hypothetical protein